MRNSVGARERASAAATSDVGRPVIFSPATTGTLSVGAARDGHRRGVNGRCPAGARRFDPVASHRLEPEQVGQPGDEVPGLPEHVGRHAADDEQVHGFPPQRLEGRGPGFGEKLHESGKTFPERRDSRRSDVNVHGSVEGVRSVRNLTLSRNCERGIPDSQRRTPFPSRVVSTWGSRLNRKAEAPDVGAAPGSVEPPRVAAPVTEAAERVDDE